MAFNIDAFKANLFDGGHRSSNFSILITNPISGLNNIRVPLMAKASAMPAATLSTVPVSYFGRKINLAGNRTYEDWTVTIMNDETFGIRHDLEAWSHAINDPSANISLGSAAFPAGYKSDASVTLFSKTGVPTRSYNMRGIWPVSVGATDLSWESEGISEFQVTFSVDYWEPAGLSKTILDTVQTGVAAAGEAIGAVFGR